MCYCNGDQLNRQTKCIYGQKFFYVHFLMGSFDVWYCFQWRKCMVLILTTYFDPKYHTNYNYGRNVANRIQRSGCNKVVLTFRGKKRLVTTVLHSNPCGYNYKLWQKHWCGAKSLTSIIYTNRPRLYIARQTYASVRFTTTARVIRTYFRWIHAIFSWVSCKTNGSKDIFSMY